MKVVFKLAFKNLLTNKKRTLFTLLCVIFSLSLIGIVFGILDSLFSCINFQNDIEAEQVTRQISTAFIIVSCFMSCLSIYTAFSISIQERIKSFGFLTSVGMSSLQKSVLILYEALLYAIIGVIPGTFLGIGVSAVFYNVLTNILGDVGVQMGKFVISAKSVFICILLGLITVFFASFFPMLRMRKLSVTETINDNNQINISLKQTLLSSLSEKLFGRIGFLAGQNYDNNKIKYRAISIALSGGMTFFITVYSFFRYPIWYNIHKGYDTSEYEFWYYMTYAACILMAYFVLVFLFCSIGAARQNMVQRRKEFAMYKSMGMQNSELQKMMSIECFFFTWYSIWFGLIGSLLGNYMMCNFWRIMGTWDLKFTYPFNVFFIFVLLNVIAGAIFAIYSRHSVSNINIIETIRNG